MRHLTRWLAVIALVVAFGNGMASAQGVLDFEAHGERINLSIGDYPQLVPIPGYPVYYAPDTGRNYFFYDGLYWVYHRDRWYVSDWYNGPWEWVDSSGVPLFILRIPVRYYPDPPMYFGHWDQDRAPRWQEYWGRDWADAHRGWDRFDRRRMPSRAPLPDYQRHFQGDRYPSRDERDGLRSEHYRFTPQDPAAHEFLQRLQGDHPREDRDRFAPPERRRDEFRPEERRPDDRRPEEGRPRPYEDRREEDRRSPEPLLEMFQDERSHDSRPPPESVPRREDQPRPDAPPRASNELRRGPAVMTRPSAPPPVARAPQRETPPTAATPAASAPEPAKPPKRTERRERDAPSPDAPRL